MDIILATSNSGKVKEIEKIVSGYEVTPYTSLIDPFDIVEDGETFKQNALIKAHAVYEALGREDVIVISDDSGISVEALGFAPGVYSARFAREGASDAENLQKMIDSLKTEGVKSSYAYYSCAIAIVGRDFEYTTHGFMYGEVVDRARGSNGFGYDPCFIPRAYNETLGELDDSVKKSFSHRGRALKLAELILKNLLTK